MQLQLMQIFQMNKNEINFHFFSDCRVFIDMFFIPNLDMVGANGTIQLVIISSHTETWQCFAYILVIVFYQ